jgi:hypothetical protein
MNYHAPLTSADDDFDVFLSLALTQRRLSHQYRQWARQDEAHGDLTAYRRNTKEADRLWECAKWHLNRARQAQPEYVV